MASYYLPESANINPSAYWTQQQAQNLGFQALPVKQSGMTLVGQGQAQEIQGTQGAQAGSPDLGVGDIGKATEGAELLKSRYVDQNPWEQFLQGARTGTLAMLGRQEEINRSQLEAGLARSGQGLNALRRTGARSALDTEIAYRYMGAEKGLAELGMATADRAMGALNDYIGSYLNIAGRRQGAYSAYWNRYAQNRSAPISAGGRSTAGITARIRQQASDVAEANRARSESGAYSMGGADYNPNFGRGVATRSTGIRTSANVGGGTSGIDLTE